MNQEKNIAYVEKNKKRYFLDLAAVIIVASVVGYTFRLSDSLLISILRLCVGACMLYSLLKGIHEKDLMNPYIFFSLTPLSLLLYNEKISSWYFNELTAKTWILGFINFLAFLFILNLVIRKKKDSCIKNNLNRTSKHTLLQHAWILFVLGEFSFIYVFITHKQFFLSSVLSYFVFPALALAWKAKHKLTIVFMYLFICFTFAVSFNKTIFLGYILITAICYKRYYVKNSQQEKRLYIGLFCAGFLFVFVAFPMKALVQERQEFSVDLLWKAIKSYFVNSNGDYHGRITWNAAPVLRMPYIYLTSAWNNVQYVMETQSNLTYGLWFFKPLISWLQLDGLFLNAYELTAYSSFNTFTYVTVLFKDFGLIGSTVSSGFLGFFVGKIYNKYKTSNSAFDVAIYAVVSQATLEMFFSNHFFMLSYPFTIVVICMIYRYLFHLPKSL